MKTPLTLFYIIFIAQSLFGQTITIDTYPEELFIENECILSSPSTHPEVVAYLNNNGNGSGSSTCGTIIWTIESIDSFDITCGNWELYIDWKIEDSCGNFVNYPSTIFIEEFQSTEFTTPPADITINCGDPNSQTILNDWLNSLGGGILEVSCNNELDTVVTYFPVEETCPFNGDINVDFEIFTCGAPGAFGSAVISYTSTIIEFSTPTVSFSESSLNAQICLDSNDELFENVDVEITLLPSGSAMNGTDFGPISTTETYTLVAGPANTQCFDVSLVNDMLVEPMETIYFEITNLSSPTNLEIIGASDELIISIIDSNDSDNDGIENSVDNCPNDFNPFQEDIDQDGSGDPCDMTNTVSQAVEVADNLYLNQIYSGVILKDQDSKCWMITVQLDGALKTTLVTCPN